MEWLSVAEIFRDFTGRDADLRRVTRWSLKEVMLYRSNLYTHSHRTASIVRAMKPIATNIFGQHYDPLKAELMAYVHDDAEIVFGDIQAGNKSKMTPEQLAEVKRAEERAITGIVKRFPSTIAGYPYEQLLREFADYSSLESQLVSYADKYDGLGEAFHEIFAGNSTFAVSTVNEYGEIPSPPSFYVAIFQKFGENFSDLKPLLATHAEMFEPMVDKDYSDIAAKASTYTAATVSSPTGDRHYDIWKRIVLADTNDEVRAALHSQIEYLQ